MSIPSSDSTTMRRALRLPAWVALVGALGLAVACATATPLTGPHGEVRYYVECSGYGTPLTACLDKADALCHFGYRLLWVRTAPRPGAEPTTWVDPEAEIPESVGEGIQGQSVLVQCTGTKLP